MSKDMPQFQSEFFERVALKQERRQLRRKTQRQIATAMAKVGQALKRKLSIRVGQRLAREEKKRLEWAARAVAREG